MIIMMIIIIVLFFLVCFAVPPTKIEIEGVKSGSRLSVRENEMVELKCVVHNAKPKATIVWFRENVEFYSGKPKHSFSL